MQPKGIQEQGWQIASLATPLVRYRSQALHDLCNAGTIPEESRRKDDNNDEAKSTVSDDEDIFDLKQSIQADIVFSFESNTLKDRIKKAPKRVLQQIDYARPLEDRIADLEKRFGGLETNGIDPPPANDEADGEPQAILALNRVSFEDYRPKNKGSGVRKAITHRYGLHESLKSEERSPQYLLSHTKESKCCPQIIQRAHLGFGAA